MIPRLLQPLLREKLAESKIVVLRGPRRSGRKTLLHEVLSDRKNQFIAFDCSDKKVRRSLLELSDFRAAIGEKAIVLLEEAQYLDNLQNIIDYSLNNDHIENLILSCSFEPVLQEELWEALRYQGLELLLYPISYPEMVQQNGMGEEEKAIIIF